MKNLLNITDDEWSQAELYFQEHPKKLKMRKKSKKPNLPHSFIKIAGVIYAMDNGHYLGKGSYGKVRIAQKCTEALQKLHQKRIIHADIKPANFMALIKDQDVHIKLVDFGFAMLLKPNENHCINHDGVGTLDYMAPEIFSKESYSFAS